MATFTRLQLRSFVTDSADFSVNRNFELKNNLSTTAYFNIEGVGEIPIFESCSLSSLVNCSVITESMHAGFIINPNSTASFTLEPTVTIPSQSMRFAASNALVFNVNDLTSSGSAFGVDLDTDA